MEVKGGLFQILTKVKAKPGLYIGRPSLSDLFMFLVGYKTARRELGIEPTAEEIRFYQEFHQFVEKKYNLHTSNAWAKIILLYCPDEKQGFERFFELLEEFQPLWYQDAHTHGVEEKEPIRSRVT
ncbi:MAG TPA: hypothetical protein DD379_00550 [Cyanobacteria bacterium UBA11162]|nr:hypothetical protein [Cyanobacteria bacterium UBA11162]